MYALVIVFVDVFVPPEVKVNIEEGVKLAQDICRGMAYLHSLEPLITRFDLNPYHVFVSAVE